MRSLATCSLCHCHLPCRWREAQASRRIYLSRVTQPMGIRQLACAQKMVQPLRHYTARAFSIIVFPRTLLFLCNVNWHCRRHASGGTLWMPFQFLLSPPRHPLLAPCECSVRACAFRTSIPPSFVKRWRNYRSKSPAPCRTSPCGPPHQTASGAHRTVSRRILRPLSPAP